MNHPPSKAPSQRPRKESSDLHGVLIIDKESGPTSHDIVHRIRRTLGEKRVGHAGTLDPMASGVLVVLLGEATKLSAHLTAHDKHYETIVALGTATNTLDAEGEIVSEAALSDALLAEAQALNAALQKAAPGEIDLRAFPLLFEAIRAERERTSQIPPAFSAIKIEGVKSYELAREGEQVEHAARAVRVHALELLAPAPPFDSESATPNKIALRFSLAVSKGYYVRSFARDLGAHLGTYAHLIALRRTRSGPFGIENAVSSKLGADDLKKAIIPLERAALLGLPAATLTPEGEKKARDGKRLCAADFSEPPPEKDESFAWLAGSDANKYLVAIGHHDGEQFRVERGFARAASSSSSSPSSRTPDEGKDLAGK